MSDTQKTSVVIVDDEPLARARLQRLIDDLPQFSVVGEAANGEQAMDLVKQLKPAIVCLDIRMPGVDGITVAKNWLQHAANDSDDGYVPGVIFCTAYDDMALQAFEANAVDYLLKPVNREKLSKALDKAALLSSSDKQSRLAVAEQLSDDVYITVQLGANLQRIAFADVRALVAEQKYVTLHHTKGQAVLDDSLTQLEAQYDEQLLRVHRSALVSKRHIMSLKRDAMGKHSLIIADLDLPIPVSRRQLSAVKALLKQK